MKACTKCQTKKELEEFKKDNRNACGRGAICKVCHNVVSNQWHKDNHERSTANWIAYLANNPEKERLRKQLWKKNNHKKAAEMEAKRQARIRLATPHWLTKQQRQEIKDHYALAKELQWLSEELLTVDHIIPFHGKNVSGLNVPWNLQILPRSINCIKSNKVR